MPYRVPIFEVGTFTLNTAYVYFRLSEETNVVCGKHVHVTETNIQINVIKQSPSIGTKVCLSSQNIT